MRRLNGVLLYLTCCRCCIVLGSTTASDSQLQLIDHQFGVHLSHKITPLPPIENFSTVIGLSIVLSPP
eukprot:COSAG06_NODE_5397_length_3506_cov_144.148518_1_plen_67_part_10